MNGINILLLCGGGGTEHAVSLVSAGFIKQNLIELGATVLQVEIQKDKKWLTMEKEEAVWDLERTLKLSHSTFKPDFIIPCVHGYPGETGELASLCEMSGVPYLGPDAESSILAFNKISTKLWLTNLGIPNTPFLFLTSKNEMHKAHEAFKNWGGTIFIKASKQGSSVGCYRVTDAKDLEKSILEAFKYSPSVLIERMIVGRELEISVYEYDGKLVATKPGEIVCPDHFYSYEEKYSGVSKTSTVIEAKGLSKDQIEKMQEYALAAFKGLGLRHLSRVDFFFTQDAIYINEINTFPGMTPISMFPKMLENHGDSFKHFLEGIIKKELKK